MSPIHMSRIESAVRIVLKFSETFNQHDVVSMTQLISDDCILESSDAPDGAVYSGKRAIAQFWKDFFHESPHAHIEVEEVFGSGFRCIMQWKYTWIDAAGKKKNIRGVDIIQVKKHLICKILSYVKG